MPTTGRRSRRQPETPAVIGYITGSHARSTAGALRLAIALMVVALVALALVNLGDSDP